jgi:nicotinamidase-related amidase
VVEGSASTEIPLEIAPLEGDILVTKRRVSAFSGSDLDVVLRGLGADTLVLTGLVTSGVVLSTLTEAVDLDFKLVVLKDLCSDSDEEVHRVLLEKVFPSRADVVASRDWVARIKQ